MMEYENGKRRKGRNRQRLHVQFSSVRPLILCFCSLVLLLLYLLSADMIPALSVRSGSLRPVLRVPALSVLSSIDSIQRSFHGGFPELRVENRVQFPDHLLLILSNKIEKSEILDCVYSRLSDDADKQSSKFIGKGETLVMPAISIDEYNEFRSIVRCPNAPLNYSAAVGLQFHGDFVKQKGGSDRNVTVHDWEKVVYEAVIDGNSAVVFVKGLNLRPHKESDPSYFKCRFGIRNLKKDEGFVFETRAIAAAQEVVRCVLPRSMMKNPEKARGIQVSVVHSETRGRASPPLPSVARILDSDSNGKRVGRKYELCVCTMLWNQASFLREWIMYHAWLGVERWFIYDNNSDDGLQDEIERLNSENYNVSRHVWPWIKSQEAGFSHCALRTKGECKWVGFFDVDEFFYFPSRHKLGLPIENALRTLVVNYSSWALVGGIKTDCHSFGPSGLDSIPPRGVTVGYTCRLVSPERHKSIIRPDMLASSLLNEVHHFQVKEGVGHVKLLESTAKMNHYKYQVWETFKAKFYRRVATYVVDWRENQNQGSKDRAPGLGTEAIEPPDWSRRFCEVWDTGLKDLVISNFADQVTGYLPWQRFDRQ
ncbi:PREDICTED: glycosyltransferase family 92 protein At1g27200-like isoform X2 [Tarenaya hassleriana]|uniref:glycosyltransferase family 92 protein At1g27200-like isoform X1 n=1 Tax=Tarenaya hassleriana TaxID=28532 RepID=UPI00053C9AD0|nr:PREDICTED: glycosyltransferase family 92 protein At1g27200-like isoform X1 [Tarenaya hassleriana]XP_010551468.1 PREDICTED: glycosyltransferase family 92 protein At1g27200-like isoform X2 [Tarenaya hassleriana]